MAVTSFAKQIPKSHLDPIYRTNAWRDCMLKFPVLPLPSIAAPTPAASAIVTPMVARAMMFAAMWPLLVLVLQLATCNSTGNGAQEPVTATDSAAGIVAGYTAPEGAKETALAFGIVRVVRSIGVLLLAWLSALLPLLILRVGVLAIAAVRLLVLRLTVPRLGGVLLLGRILLLLLIVLGCGSATGVSD